MREQKPILEPERTFSEVANAYNHRNAGKDQISRTTAYNECKAAEKKIAGLLSALIGELPSPARIERLIRENWNLPKLRGWARDVKNQLKLPF